MNNPQFSGDALTIAKPQTGDENRQPTTSHSQVTRTLIHG